MIRQRGPTDTTIILLRQKDSVMDTQPHTELFPNPQARLCLGIDPADNGSKKSDVTGLAIPSGVRFTG
jgi:hypothetical protein